MSDVTSTPRRRTPRRGGFVLSLLLCLTAATRLVWLVILPSHAVSADLLGWRHVAIDLFNHLNPYSATVLMNYPPFWMEVLFGLGKFAASTGVDLLVSIRIVLIAGDLSLLAATYLLLRTLRPHSSCVRLLVIGYCLNPLLILLTSQHGNIDALSMIWVVLFLYFLIRFRNSSDAIDWLLAAACLGIAAFVKQFPLVLWPLLAPGARRLDWRCRLAGPLLMIGPVLLSLAPLYILAPGAIWHDVVGYRSFGNAFGLAGLLAIAGFNEFLPVYARFFSAALLAVTIAVAIALWRRDWRHDSDPVLFSALLLLSLFTLGSGYGPQYWFWIIPLLLVCYPNYSPGLSRVILVTLTIVAATNVFEYAFEITLGCFLYNFHPSDQLESIGRYFDYPSIHVVWLRMPMTFAAFTLLGWGIAILSGRYHREGV
jgi:glycosyl transferase family 87